MLLVLDLLVLDLLVLLVLDLVLLLLAVLPFQELPEDVVALVGSEAETDQSLPVRLHLGAYPNDGSDEEDLCA